MNSSVRLVNWSRENLA